MIKPVGRSSDPAPILRMFEKTSPRLIDVAAVRMLFDKFATQAAAALSEFAPVEMNTRLEQLELGCTVEFLQAAPRVVTMAGSIVEWGATAFIRLDQMLLFRLLDAMYGGDPNQRAAMPARPLTALEGALAVQLAKAIMAKLRDALTGLCSFSFHGARIVDPAVAAEAAGNSLSVFLAMRVVETGESISIIVPAGGLELIREKTNSRDERKSEPGLDPEWSVDFRKSVLATTVALSAVVQGPAMTINDVARLQVGSVIEFDADALKRVRIESDDKPLFIGCLGQGRGVFTVLLEDVVTSTRRGPT
jgi:flagellar motor switch protein FliM